MYNDEDGSIEVGSRNVNVQEKTLENFYGFSNHDNITFNNDTLELEGSGEINTFDKNPGGGMVFYGDTKNGKTLRIVKSGAYITAKFQYINSVLPISKFSSPSGFETLRLAYVIGLIKSPFDVSEKPVPELPNFPSSIPNSIRSQRLKVTPPPEDPEEGEDVVDNTYTMSIENDGMSTELHGLIDSGNFIYGIYIYSFFDSLGGSGNIIYEIQDYNVKFFKDLGNKVFPKLTWA